MSLARMRISSLAVVLAGYLGSGYGGLIFGQNNPLRTVSGSVINAVTNEPIRRALVAIGPVLVFTGADGRFRAENIPEGRTMIAAQKPGYFDCPNRGCEQGSRARTMINVESETSDVVLKLTPESAVEGRIVDEDGEPVSNIQVTALGAELMNGLKHYGLSGSASTDENGNYQVEGLMPGSYMIKTTARSAFFQFAPAADAQQEMYPQRYYPNTPDEGAAQTLEVRPGQTATADFTIPRVAAVRIRGTITPAVNGVTLTAEDGSGEEMYMESRYRPQTGKFAAFLPTGTWTLHFNGMDATGVNYTAVQPVTATKNIEEMRVGLQPLASIPVKVTQVSGNVEIPINISLISRERHIPVGFFNTGGQIRAGQAPDVITNVAPGKYSVIVSAGNQCVDSLTSGSVDLLQDDLVVLPGSQTQPINLVMRRDCATLQVSVHSDDPQAPSTIVLVPSARSMLPSTSFVEAGASATLSDLAPGEYKVYAFSNIDGLEYANPEVMRAYPGQDLTLAPNQHAALTLNVITR